MTHLYNRWLPPPLAEELGFESQRFHALVGLIQQTLQTSSLSSRLTSLKWISVVNTFLKAKSAVELVDVEDLVKASLDILLMSSDNLYIQTRWANCLAQLLSKYRKKLNLEIEWRPLYNLLLDIHFKRRSSYEGLRLKSSHLTNLIYLTEACRRFFSKDSAAEIWFEFKPKFGDVSHNSALEAAGFVCLFLPTKTQKKAQMDKCFFTRTWLAECLELWSAIPTCRYWNVQWALLLSRCAKDQVLDPSDWEPFLPQLFTNFLNAFDVPVGRAGAWSPVHRRIPFEIKRAFNSSWSPGLSTLTAKSIVYLLSPCGSAQVHFNTMIDFLEQYYHPSNGGSWTGSLQRFLRFLVFYFLKRLANENGEKPNCGSNVEASFVLGPIQRKAFVTSVMKLIDRGQYSKNGALAQTAASAASRLSYVEPSIMLPLVISRFHTALETITATHQLQSALRMLALSARALLLHDSSAADKSLVTSRTSLADAMFSTLPGLDANDPPKTLATMQLYCAVLSSVGKFDNEGDSSTKILPINWSSWVDEFLDRLFTLLVNLEPSVQSSNDVSSDDGFLTEKGSAYSYLMDLLFGKVTELQYKQVLKRTVKFVTGNILPGAIEEVGLLCCYMVGANPKEASAQLLAPIMNSLLASLEDSPRTGFSGSEEHTTLVDFKVGLSPALEMTTRYHLSVLSKAVFNGGSALIAYKSLLQQVISAAFEAPSSKVNDAGSNLLISTIGSMIWYYPISSPKASSFYINAEGLEEWISMKNNKKLEEWVPSLWHIPEHEELMFVNDIVDCHLRNPLASLKKICEEGYKSKYSGQEKENLRVFLLRMEGVLCGLGSCLPDFCSADDNLSSNGAQNFLPLTIVGGAGATVATSKLREETAEIIHQLCEYILKNKSDDYILMKKIISIMDMVGNYGSIEYYSYLLMKGSWDDNCHLLAEPCTNFINKSFCNAKRRPWWFVVERVFVHNIWRASQAGYRCYNDKGMGLLVPSHISMLSKDLLRLSLHSYSDVRLVAARNLKNMLQRYPMLIQECMPLLTKSLQDPKATKESALGSCEMLMSMPVMRHLRQDWAALASFLLALLGSAHHESVEAQAAISELFVAFNTSFGGIPAKADFSSGDDSDSSECMTYSSMVSYVRDLLTGDSITIHWRYNLMAHGILLFLVLPVSYHEKHAEEGIVSNLRCAVAGGFLNNLKSELPPLRPLSVIALLFLLEATRRSEEKNEGSRRFSVEVCHSDGKPLLCESSMTNVLNDGKFGENVVNKLAVDRQSVEGDGYGPQYMSDAGLTALMPTYMREWPHTRTWEPNMEGEKFSPTFAKLFKRLVQEFGSIVLNLLHGPLEEASGATEDRGKLCIAAEILAGLLHSDADCVIAAWDEWICPLLRKYLLLPTLESAPEWAACIRFAVGGKGRIGSRAPMLRHKILKCVAEPLPKKSSTTMIAKRYMFLRAALLELLPGYSVAEEISFQKDLLNEILHLSGHPSPQVRKSVGSMLCLLLSNLSLFSKIQQGNNNLHGEEDVTEGTCSLLINKSMDATKMIINADLSSSDIALSRNTGDGTFTKPNKEFVKQMESMLYFLAAAIRSGRTQTLMNTVVGLIYPTLSLQETSEKDLSALARSALRFLQWQLFPVSHLPQVVEVALNAANDSNWHTRVALLTFLQPFMYRHKFILSNDEVKSLWDKVAHLILDPQLEVREAAATTLSGMMKGAETTFAKPFRQEIADKARLLKKTSKCKRRNGGVIQSMPTNHGVVLGLSAVILSVPYDMPRWLPDMVTLLAEFANEPWPIRGTVTKTIGKFRHTHSDMWDFQKDAFTEQQLEVLLNSTSSATYFA